MILDRIVEQKKQEVKLLKKVTSIRDLKKGCSSLSPARSITENISSSRSVGLIAEIKKGSPSKGIIRADFDPEAIARTYTQAGAAAISVLTDEKFFFGSPAYLQAVRRVTDLPLLRKDFIIDAWQIYESRLLGADGILLIAAVLDDSRLSEFLGLAREMGLESLVEVHTEEELARVQEMSIELLGVNNRDLHSFKTDIHTTLRLSRLVTDPKIKIISESGINTRSDVEMLENNGVAGILVGESLMREVDITGKINELLGRKGVA